MKLRLCDHVFEVEVASSPSELQTGLSKHASLAPDAGMLFDFGETRDASFHQATVPFSLDVIGLDSESRIVKIVASTKPGSKDYWSFKNVAGVLELPGGTAEDIGARIGDMVEEASDLDDTDEEYYKQLMPDELAHEYVHPKVAPKGPSKTAQVADPVKFADKVAPVLEAHASNIPFTADALNGGATERAVINRQTMAQVLQDASFEATQYILEACGTAQGLQALGQAFVAAGLCDFTRAGITNNAPMLVLYKATAK